MGPQLETGCELQTPKDDAVLLCPPYTALYTGAQQELNKHSWDDWEKCSVLGPSVKSDHFLLTEVTYWLGVVLGQNMYLACTRPRV